MTRERGAHPSSPEVAWHPVRQRTQVHWVFQRAHKSRENIKLLR
jgi:hypothetical protein